MEPAVQSVLDLVPAFRGREVRAQPLVGGLTNRNYRLDAGGESFVLRIAGDNTGLLGIDRAREAVGVRTAAAAGVGAELVAFLPEQSALVTRFVQGRQLTEEDMHRPEILRRVARALRAYHDFPVPGDLGRFCPFAVVRSYHALAIEKNVPLPEYLGSALRLLAQLEQEVRTDEPLCLCHNDLLPANFIDEGAVLRLIDWEYAGRGDRFFDLGNLAVNHQLTDAEEQWLLEGYYGEVRPEHLRRLRLMRLASDMREGMWGFLQAGISTLHTPAFYLGYGEKHVRRFLEAAATNELGGG
jgi:thiamine kinase-like enzyme